MRLFFASLVVCLLPNVLLGQSISVEESAVVQRQTSTEFQLGGAAMRSARVPSALVDEAEATSIPKLAAPNQFRLREDTRQESNLGAATIFLAEGLDAGRDAFEFGTFLKRGQARAGVSVTYLEEQAELARSEVFVDYALTQKLSVGVSGIFDSNIRNEDPVRQLGLNAEFESSGGTFVQGGIAGAPDYDPVIGLSVGLRF